MGRPCRTPARFLWPALRVQSLQQFGVLDQVADAEIFVLHPLARLLAEALCVGLLLQKLPDEGAESHQISWSLPALVVPANRWLVPSPSGPSWPSPPRWTLLPALPFPSRVILALDLQLESASAFNRKY